MSYKFKKLVSCVKDELIELRFTGAEKMYSALLSETDYAKYDSNLGSVKRILVSSPVYFRVQSDGEWYIVHDLDGKDINEIEGDIRRFSPSFSIDEAKSFTAKLGTTYVMNAHDTEADESMIQYWKDNKNKLSAIDLSKSTYKCPSCNKLVGTSKLNGAHVVKVKETKKNLYIVPTCETCNKSKVDRIFKVSAFDLIEAPE